MTSGINCVLGWRHSQRSRMENEMDAELRFHIESYAEDLVATAWSPERYAASEFGGIDRTKEKCREARSVNS